MKTVKFCDYEWYVLEEQDDKALLLAKDIITKKAYHETYRNITWENCTLRKWLNSDFYESLEKCHANILDTEIRQEGFLWCVTDKIFLLSIGEHGQYNIPLAEGWWWLRSPGRYSDFAAGVSVDGGIYFCGNNVGNASGGVRPAMWVDTLCLETV